MDKKKNFLQITKQKKLEDLLKSTSLPSSWKLEILQEGLCLKTDKGESFVLDFSKLQPLSRGQPLVKAIGCKKNESWKVLDVTAGWGQDAFLLSCLGCEVLAIESHPLVFAFLIDAISKKNLQKPNSLKFILDNSLNYLKTIKDEDRPNVIYIDPMFKPKKSLSKLPLKILEDLVGETKQSDNLFKQSLHRAINRVVVKRHRLEKPKQGAIRLCSFSGRSVCYDVFAPQEKRK